MLRYSGIHSWKSKEDWLEYIENCNGYFDKLLEVKQLYTLVKSLPRKLEPFETALVEAVEYNETHPRRGI